MMIRMKKKDYMSLSKRYRESGRGFLSKEEVSAYIAGRMPATKAAIRAVFEEVAPRIPNRIQTFLDLGAGPGTGLMAASEVFGELSTAVLVESNPYMVEEGKKLVEAHWVAQDLFLFEPKEADCALLGYSYGELESKKRLDLLKKVFYKTKLLVIVEPGTPTGYENILEARDFLLSLSGHMVAPCPHERACPMQGKDWCHFSVRVPRSKEHRALKCGVLGYEDEKFSYVTISKEPAKLASGRIVRHPLKQKGHVILSICAQEGLIEKTVSKKAGDDYRLSRKAGWGQETSLHLPKPHCL